MPLTAVLCSMISSTISGLGATLITCCIFMKRKKRREDHKQNQPNTEPEYEIPCPRQESSAKFELKENMCYASKF